MVARTPYVPQLFAVTWSRAAQLFPVDAIVSSIPAKAESLTTVSLINTLAHRLAMMSVLNPRTSQFSICKAMPLLKAIPLPVLVVAPGPITVSPFRVTKSEEELAFTSMPSPPALVTVIPAYTPCGAVIVTAWAMEKGPYPAESRTTISPPGAVCAIAAVNVRHAAVSEQLLVSRPFPETKVRAEVPAASDAEAHNNEN